MNSIGLAVTKSVVLHLVIGAMFFVSMDFVVHEQPELPSDQPVIEAVVIDQAALEQQLQKIEQQRVAQQRAEEERVRELERRAQDAEQKRREEQRRAADAERQRKQKLAEKRRAEQAAQEARLKQQREREEAERLERERKKKEEERRKAEEAARKAKEEREREERRRQEERERAEQERVLNEQLQAEQAARQRKRNQVVLTEVQKYQALIRQTIQRHLIVDDSFIGKSCRLNIRLASNGLVTQVRVLEGDAALCRAAQSAVLKPDTLPVSPEADVFEELKDITLTVEPQN